MKSPRISKLKSRIPPRSAGKGNQRRKPGRSVEKILSVAKSGAPIGAVIRAIAGAVPLKEWQKIPADLSHQHDHYLYGSPKR